MTLYPGYTDNEAHKFVDVNQVGPAIRTLTVSDAGRNTAGYISTLNSNSTPLLADGVYTGAAEDITNYGIIFVNVYSDVASAQDGLKIQQSSDGVNWDHDDKFTIPAGNGRNFSINPHAKYFRIVYTNGSVEQNVFRIQSIVKSNSKPSSHRIQDSINTDDDAELVKSVLTGETPDGTFTNFQATRNGNFRVSINEYGDTPAVDSFARLRVSQNYTIFDSKQLHDKQPLFWDESLGGSATSVHTPTDACVLMSVTDSASDFVIRQTKQRFNYQPGKSQLIFMTFQSPIEEGTTKRIGYFDGTGTNNLTPNNGIFYETDGAISWNIAKNGTITESVTQQQWNVDTLDGNGPSGITLDTTAAQILIIDFEWLGVGRVRVGFVINGLVYYCHYFNHANISGFSSVYMSTPNLPLRYSIQTDGTVGGSMNHICSSVISEGGIEQTGILRSVSTGSTHVDANVADTTYAIKGVRQKADYVDITIIPEQFSMIDESGGAFRWSLQLNPTVAGTFTYVDVADSALQEATGVTANTVTTPGLIIDSGFVGAAGVNAGTGISSRFVTSLRIGSTIAGTRDELVLCVTPLSANADIQGSLTLRELL